ncbi:MAG: methyltransferase domain-containing protein [Candidatus Omnitrophica bacterium]|nr:methyltransferase domain-containing protein [Candidatus Omnitrophota bacterium]
MLIQKKRSACISCGSPLADDIVIIGEQYPSAVFVSDSSPVASGLTATSLNLTRCTSESCRLVQLANEYDLQYVFDHYPYESGSTATMKQILQDVVDDALRIIPLCSDDVVLDIGGNDGTLLSLIKEPVRARVNIDAAAGVAQLVSAPDYRHVHSRFNAQVYRSLGLPSPRLIFSVAMFYHLNNPIDFCRGIREIMSDNSVWVLQMTYLGTMLRDNIFDNIVHEHAAYYSLSSLEALLSRVGLHIAEARLIESYGGSLRVFIVKDPEKFPGKYRRKDYVDIQRFETEQQTNTFEALRAFNGRAQLLRDSIGAIVDHLVQRWGPLWGFGASTKGNMILQYLGIKTDRMSCILDNSPKKIGTWTMGSMIPIVDEALYLDRLPEYLFVLPYYYTNAFVRIIQKRLAAGSKVYLFVPLPHPHFVTVAYKGGK